MYVARIVNSGSSILFPTFELFLISHTKPGPNMASAAAMKVSLKDAGEEKEVLILLVKLGDMGEGVGERVEKK